jgi:diguanylate cyclase (GGDEF)-like protein
VLPGMITYSATEVTKAAKRLTSGTLRDFSLAMAALGRGDLEAAHASVDIVPVRPNSHDELGEMAESFNILQQEVRDAALGLGEAREKLRMARAELIARHEYIAYLAHHDALTKLPNRQALTERLEQAVQRAATTGTGFSVLSADLDSFKEANDVFGHAVGDELLCAVARRLQEVAQGTFIARVGGDEFTFVVDLDSRLTDALAARLLVAVAEPFEVHGQRISIDISIGEATYPADGQDAMALLANADAALYRAKADGGHALRQFDPEMDRRIRERYAMQHDLRSAIGNGELLLHYQPQAKMSGEVFGFEALARWQSPKHGFVSPGIFIPLAEQNGTIVDIGEWTLLEACWRLG